MFVLCEVLFIDIVKIIVISINNSKTFTKSGFKKSLVLNFVFKINILTFL